jgi:hypothetical protein
MGVRPSLHAALAALLAGLFAASLPMASPAVPPSGLPAELESFLNAERQRLCRLYDVSPEACAAPIAVRVVATREDLGPEEAPFVPPYAAGVAQPARSWMAVILSRCGPYPFGDERQTLTHELSHVLLYRCLGFEPPRWFDEGLAMRVSGDWSGSDELWSALALPAVARGSWRLQRVETDFAGGEGQVRRSYALSKGFLRDLFRSDAGLTGFLREARRLRSVDAAFRLHFGETPERAFTVWAKDLPWWGEWIVFLTSPGTLWTAILLLFLLAVAVAVRRRRLKYEQLPD